MSHHAIRITLLIGAVVLAQAVSAQPPGGGRGGQPPQGRGGSPDPLLQAFDTDRDGTLSAAEIDVAA